MNPLKELKGMVSTTPKIETGIVTSTNANGIYVRTRSGLKSFSIPNASAYKPGDTVRFQDNLVLGRAVGIESLPVFKV